MTAPGSVPLHALTEDNLASASPDLLRAMVKAFADALMSAEADALCGAAYGQVSDERVNHRNGYRPREWDTRAGTVELALPELRQGSYFPTWLLERRRRTEQALISVVATAYLLGVSTRRVEKLAQSLGVTQLSKSQVSAMAKHLDEQVTAFRNRPLDAGPYAFVWVDALTQKVREAGRITGVHALVAVGVNADGHREILGLDVATAEDGAGWLAFLRSLTARGLGGVQLVVSDAHTGLVNASEPSCPALPGNGAEPTGAVKNQGVASRFSARCAGLAIKRGISSQLTDRFSVLLPHLDERQRRLAVAAEARLLGHGGVRVVARAAGMSETTVRRGVEELEAGKAPLPIVRVRGPVAAWSNRSTLG